MLQILQTKHFENYVSEIEELNISNLNPNVVEATDKDEIIGLGIYHFEDDKVVLDKVDANGDLYLYDGIVRAVLFLAMMKGYDVARFDLNDLTNVKKLAFVQNNDNLLEGINEFMSKCKSCGK